jgi:hypothetical protein
VLTAESLRDLRAHLSSLAQGDRRLLDEICSEIRSLKGAVRTIRPRGVTAVSLVASDGGNNRIAFDPFFVQLVRVVDSYGQELFLEVITPTTDPDALSRRQFNEDGSPRTCLARMIIDLGAVPQTLQGLSPMIPSSKEVREHPERVSRGWVLVYRDLCEWAVLYDRICHHAFATDTLFVRDGLLRSKIFHKDLFMRLIDNLEKAIQKTYDQSRRRTFLVGMAKHSKVLDRYSLALSLEDVLPTGDACYVPIPRELEKKAYRWQEWARGVESDSEEEEKPKFVGGSMFLVRFGSRSSDPVWPVDVFSGQVDRASEILGYLLADAREGFPVPYYPRCLSRAHEHAQIVDFDLTILQDIVFDTVRDLVPAHKRGVLDAHRLRTDVAGVRYE